MSRRRDRRAEHRRYRSTAELIRAVRDEHSLTQAQLAARAGLGAAQVNRYERGRVEPGQDALRRLLSAVGQAPTYGVEPIGAALDERLDVGDGLWWRVGWDTFLAVERLVWPAVDAGVPLALGGELAAVAHGVPVPDPRLLVHVREEAVPALAAAARRARAVLATPDGYPPELRGQEGHDDDLVIDAYPDAVRVLVSAVLPANALVEVPRYAHEATETISVATATVEELLGSGLLGPTALALVERLAERAEGGGTGAAGYWAS